MPVLVHGAVANGSPLGRSGVAGLGPGERAGLVVGQPQPVIAESEGGRAQASDLQAVDAGTGLPLLTGQPRSPRWRQLR